MRNFSYIKVKDLPDKIRLDERKSGGAITGVEIPDEGLDLKQAVSQFEKNILQKALEKSGWVKNRAANLLNLNRTTYVEKLKRYDIT